MKYAWVIKGDFFRLWSGTFLSLFSSILFYYSLVWWSLSETGSALSGSVVIGIGLTVSILVSPFTGWLSDRFHRGKLIAASDMIISAVFLMIGFLALSGMNSVFLLAASRVIVSACLTAIEPAARSLLPDTLRKEQIEKRNRISRSAHTAHPSDCSACHRGSVFLFAFWLVMGAVRKPFLLVDLFGVENQR